MEKTEMSKKMKKGFVCACVVTYCTSLSFRRKKVTSLFILVLLFLDAALNIGSPLF
jgi:hypothetical protein